MADRCSFCGSTDGPFSHGGGVFTVFMCPDCQALLGQGRGPYPAMSRAEIRQAEAAEHVIAERHARQGD